MVVYEDVVRYIMMT